MEQRFVIFYHTLTQVSVLGIDGVAVYVQHLSRLDEGVLAQLKNDLAKAEWNKVYGVIYGQKEAAEEICKAAVAAATDEEKAAAELKAFLEANL